MQGQLSTSIVLYGNIDSSDAVLWRSFYNYATKLIESVNLSPNYLGVVGQSFKTGKISPLSKTQKKLYKSLEDGEEVASLAVYSLPEDFKTASFDYNIYICRTNRLNHPHIIATFLNSMLHNINTKELLYELKYFIEFDYGEVFELNTLEIPQIYASKANSPTSFKSLRILDSLTV